MAKLSFARNAAATMVAVLLTGCLVPETIDANIVLEGYEYDMRVETRLAHPHAIKAIADGHVFIEEDRMRAEEGKAPDARLESFAYAGEGRFDLVVKLT